MPQALRALPARRAPTTCARDWSSCASSSTTSSSTSRNTRRSARSSSRASERGAVPEPAPPVVSSGRPSDAPPVASEPEAKQRRFPCKSCGADLEFKPGSESIACARCGHVEAIPRSAEAIREFAYNDYLANPAAGLGAGAKDARCGSCGAVVRLESTTKATRCPFCGTALVDDAGDVGAADVRPEAVAPFRVDAGAAARAFDAWAGKLWFAPGSLRAEARRTTLRGVYCPYWTFDAHTISHYQGERGDAYYVQTPVTVMVNGRPQVQMTTVRHVRWSWREGTHTSFFDDVLVCASKHPEVECDYDVKRLVPYSPKFLAGFDAERPAVETKAAWPDAKERIARELYAACCRKIGGDEQRNVDVRTAYQGITFKMVLLPVFLASYRYGEKVFRFQVDGQTGAVRGERPYSAWKIALLVAVILAVVAIVALIASQR